MGLVDLLSDTFGIDIGLLDRFGGPDQSSMPFGYFDGAGRCVANFSAFSMPLMIDGRIVRATGYQSGAVRPEYRGQGLYRDLMIRAFAWALDQGSELDILLTDKPGLYHPFGLVSVPQFFVQGSSPALQTASQSVRPISLENSDDRQLVMDYLGRRRPVSREFAVLDQRQEFALNACFDPDMRLSHIPDAIVAWKLSADGIFQLFDVVASVIPTLSKIVGALGLKPSQVEVYFPTDLLEWSGTPKLYQGSCDLMVSTGAAGAAFPQHTMLSPMADF